MPNFAENFGLETFFEEEDVARGFMGYLIQEGKAINGYYECPTLFNSMSDIDLYVKTQKAEDGGLVVVDLDTHCSGTSYWVMRNTGIDITVEGARPTERVFMFENAKSGEGLVPIYLVNADVLPSFARGGLVNMQVCALPLEISCYSNEDEYAAAQPTDREGRVFAIADGSLIPIEFLVNHRAKDCAFVPAKSTDAVVMFRAEVQALYYGNFGTEKEEVSTFIRCIVNTQYGELVFAFTIDQIPEEQREKLCEGAVIAGTCILSGDVAILEYANGFIRDYEHNLRLLKHTFVYGEAERMRPILHKDVVHKSETTRKTYEGADEIIERLNLVHNNQTKEEDKTFAYIATIMQAEDGMKYPVGTRCVVLAYGGEKEYTSIAFITVDEEEFVTEIDISRDSRYRFEID